MRIAFYAPLNAPDGARPSGDRTIARLSMRALRDAGHEVVLASRFKSFDATGDAVRQRRLAALGGHLAQRLGRRLADPSRRPDAWLTYHLYHKAPDWIGPAVAADLGIPYLVLEASHAPKQAAGPWAEGHRAAAAAIARADLVVGLNRRDAAGVRPLLPDPDRYVQGRPLVDGSAFTAAALGRNRHREALRQHCGVRADTPLLLTVGMMRAGAKLQSYRLLAEALTLLQGRSWHLTVVGDGPVRAEVEAAFAHLCGRVTWHGLSTPEALPGLYAGADVLVWPAVKEALGMCFLEAEAAGTPVVGADTLGVPDVVAHGSSGLLAEPGSAAAFAAALDRLLVDPGLRRSMGEAAGRYALAEHDLSTAGRAFASVVEAAVARAAGRCGATAGARP